MPTTFPSGSYGDMIVKTAGVTNYFRLNDSSGAGDDYASITGTSSGCTFKQPGALAGDANRSVFFDGVNDYISFGDNFRLTSTFSLEIWIKPTVTGAATFLSKENYNAPISGWSWFLDASMIPNFTRLHNTRATAKGVAVAANKWTHLVVTYDGSMIRQYQNGVLRWEQPDAADDYSSAYHCTMGCQTDYNPVAYADWYKGYLDEFAVYNRALTAATIKQHYDKGLVPPVQYYSLADSRKISSTEARTVAASPKFSELRTIGRVETWGETTASQSLSEPSLIGADESTSIITAFGGTILTVSDTPPLNAVEAPLIQTFVALFDETPTTIMSEEIRSIASFPKLSDSRKISVLEERSMPVVVRASEDYSSVLRRQSGFVHYAVSKKVRGNFTIEYKHDDVVPVDAQRTTTFLVSDASGFPIALGWATTRWKNTIPEQPILVNITLDVDKYPDELALFNANVKSQG